MSAYTNSFVISIQNVCSSNESGKQRVSLFEIVDGLEKESVMHDLKIIIKKEKYISEQLKRRSSDFSLNGLPGLWQERCALKAKSDTLKHDRKNISKTIGLNKKNGVVLHK